MFAQTVSRAAEKTNEVIVERSEKYRASIPERLDPPTNINPALRHGVFILHKGSKVFAKVTNFLRKILLYINLLFVLISFN